MSNVVQVIFFVVYFILWFVIYHSIFNVVYFDLGKGLLKELIEAILFACLMDYLTMRFWVIAIIVVVLVGLGLSAKCKTDSSRGLVIILAVIFAIIVGISGYQFNRANQVEDDEAHTNVVEYVAMIDNPIEF